MKLKLSIKVLTLDDPLPLHNRANHHVPFFFPSKGSMAWKRDCAVESHVTVDHDIHAKECGSCRVPCPWDVKHNGNTGSLVNVQQQD